MHVFLSYAKADTYDLAMQLDAEISALPDVTCWVDENELEPGNIYIWAHQTQSEIALCDVMVVLISEDVNRDPRGEKGVSFVLIEISHAQKKGKRIIPVLIQDTDIPIVLASVQHIDFTKNSDTGKIKLLAHIRQLSGDTEPKPPSQAKKKALSPITQLPLVPSMLPTPFNWLNIPAGEVTLQKGGYLDKLTTFDVPAFTIAQYPITVAQYAVFSGKNFDNAKGDHPVTNVTWFDAIEFCQWLSGQTNLSITLPTEQQWQRAAQGDTGWEYPWGDEFDSSHCNTSESGIGTMTAITQYPRGASPYGVQDMSGNVWEWCLTNWKTGRNDGDKDNTNSQVMRGGSFYNDSDFAACARRNLNNPFSRNNINGFRVVCSLLS